MSYYNIEDSQINLQKLFEFVFEGNGDNRVDTEITDGYETDDTTNTLRPLNKVVREVKVGSNESRETYKYDMIKFLLSYVLDEESDEYDGNTTGFKLSLSTLVSYGILIKKNNK